MMKELTTEQSVESLFWELMKDQKKFNNGGLRLLSALIESDTTPFMKQYIKHCKSFTLHTFLTIRYFVITTKSLKLSKILSPDCIAASKVKFEEFEDRHIHFLEEKDISPITSSNFKPSQWSIDTFYNLIRKADLFDMKTDWNSWCGDVDISSEHFNPYFWDSSDQLWRHLNYKCIYKMTERRRIMIRSRFPAIFKPKDGDTPSHALMKIVTLAATHLAFKENSRKFPQERAIINENINSLLKLVVNLRDEASESVPWTAAKIIKSCGIQPETLNFAAQSPKRVLSGIHKFLKDFPLANSSWILNLLYISSKSPQYMTVDKSFKKIVKWFFDLNPSVQEICQLLEIVASNNSKLKASIISKFDSDQIRKVHTECPRYCDSILVPLENRIKIVLARKRLFTNCILSIKILSSERDHFWSLLKLVLKHESLILISNNAKFEKTFDSVTFRSLDRFLEHFLETFLNNPDLFILVGIVPDGKQVIIPSLKAPQRLVRLLFSILARSVILNFKVPFYIHYDFFEVGYQCTRRFKNGEFSKILKMKKKFYSDQNLIDNSYVAECDRINIHGENTDMLVDHVMRICTQDPLQVKVSDSTFIRLLELQFEAVHKGIFRIFPQDSIFIAEEMYSLIFKR